MDTIDPIRFIAAFVFVLGLIGALAFVLKKYTSGKQMFGAQNDAGRIKVMETRYLDGKRRLMLIRRDNVEHLLLLADGRETVVESGIGVKE